MKYKKYIILLLLVVVFGCNKAYALESCGEDDCYYKSSSNDTFLCYNPDKKKVTISLTEEENGKSDSLINFNKDKDDKETGITAPKVGDSCPTYLVYRFKDGLFNSEGIWGFNDYSTASKFVSASNDISKMSAYLTTKTNKTNYDNKLSEVFSGGLGKTNIDKIKIDSEVKCGDLFGDPNDKDSIRYLINEILQYPKIIVPILVIILGTLDFAKAVIAGKEDDMKKAQKTFIKRLIIGVVFFFVPVFVDLLMGLADIVWEGLGYTSCSI